MPVNPELNTLLLRVMTDHDITQSELADYLGYHRRTVGRMCNGETAVSLDAVRILYTLTRDQRLLQAVADTADVLALDMADAEVSRPDVSVALVMAALNKVEAVMLDRIDCPPKGECPHYLAVLDRAVIALLKARRSITSKQPIPLVHKKALLPADTRA